MNDELEQIKSSLQCVNELIDIKENPVVTAGVAGLVGKIPVIGDLINSSIDKTLEEFQQNKEDLKKVAGIDVYALKGLHSKLYLFDDTYGVLGSANFTAGGFKSNIELSLLLNNDDGILKELHSYFDDLLNKIKQSKEGQSNQGFFHESEEMP